MLFFFFSGDNKIKVELVSKLFSEGRINVLIGTKSLLGEGWDSPCINTLILASFVGSFIFSNQMRGRAIRIDPNNINKISNIWHLVTLEPTYIFKDKLSEKIDSYINEDLNNIRNVKERFIKIKESFERRANTLEEKEGLKQLEEIIDNY